jgi:nucleoside-diphosphate-sugar epimerase
MTEDEPCADKHGYGFSKHLMEEVSRYHARQFPDSTVFNLRFGGLVAAGADIKPREHVPPRPWWFTGLGMLSVSDAVDAVELALGANLGPGVHVYFIAPPKAPTRIPVADLVEQAYGSDAVDLSHFRQPGHELDAVYSIDKARAELGFEPNDLPEWM